MKPRRALVRSLLACLLALALPRAAGAACRQGANALTEQRALADLETSLEAACPCASFDGSAGRSRRDYLSCAGDVVTAAQQSGAITDECVADAKGVVAGSVCGTRGVACGTVSGAAKPRATCKVTSAAACHAANRPPRLPFEPLAGIAATPPVSPFGASGVTRQACSDETFCADVVDWTAGTCLDTRSDGPYAAGFHDARLVKQSAVDPSQQRVLDTVIWYPATPGAGPIDSGSRAVRDAPVDLSGGPYPVVMFSHGSCGFERQSLFLTPWLATHGFIVVAPPHPGNTLFDFPDCGTPSAQAASAVERPNDIIFALDYILDQGKDPSSMFHGAVDPTRLAMTGHSFGGLTTYLVTAMDDRFSVAVPMAPATGPSSKLTIPSMTMYGAIDSVVSIPGILNAYDRSSPPKYLVEIDDAGHYAFSDGCFPAPECNPPATLTQDEAHERVKREILPFLEVYLAGDRRYVPFLTTPPPPGIALTSK